MRAGLERHIGAIAAERPNVRLETIDATHFVIVEKPDEIAAMIRHDRHGVSLEPRKYSERLGVLDADQLQAACDEFGLGTVTEAEPPTGGLFGQNVILTTTSEGRFVLRGQPARTRPAHEGTRRREVHPRALVAAGALAVPG